MMKWVSLILILFSFSSGAQSTDCRALQEFRCRAGLTPRPDGASNSWSELQAKQSRIVNDVRGQLNQWISRQNLTAEQREAMLARIRDLDVRIDLSAQSRGEATYSRDENSLVVTRTSLGGPSEFLLVKSLAHEMAHAIDPCNLQRGLGFPPRPPGKRGDAAVGVAVPRAPRFPAISNLPDDTRSYELGAFRHLPFQNINVCLSRENNLGLPGLNATLSRLRQKWQLPERIMPGDGYLDDQYPLCLYTRHLESFCDFLASEVLSGYLQQNQIRLNPGQVRNGLFNIAAAACDGDNPARVQNPNVSSHPTANERVNRIFLAHPELSRRAACSNSQEYCGQPSRAEPAHPNADSATNR
jgi:hypothetical protein